MDTFDKTVQKAKDVFDIAVNKTGEFVNVSKLKFSVASLNNKLEKKYAQLGRTQFKMLKDTNVENAEIASTVADIKHIISEIKGLLREIDELEGKITCKKCGCKVPNNSMFCNNCGERF